MWDAWTAPRAHQAQHLLAQLAQPEKPAGGAALDQIAIATGGAAALTAALLVLGFGHRTGRIGALASLARAAERGPARGMPGWAALPTLVAFWSLLTALLGMYWDISLHITQGRDEGPLANLAHYPILIGLFGIFTAGVLAMVLPKGERPGPAAIRITRHWYAPTGGVLLAGAGFYALLGFPLDDVWHRIFGQDVTLWGPTHLMLIGGAGLSLVAMMVLEREGRLAADAGGGPQATPAVRYVRRVMTGGGLLIGLSVFQAEYDFGVSQFRLVHQPLLIALAAGCALVAVRLWAGRLAAVGAVLFYMIVRGGVAVLVGPVIGELWAAVPLYLAEAICVELAALALARRPLLLGAVGGLLIGTAGFAAEYAWTQFAYRVPWTGDIAVEGTLMAVTGGVAGGLAGALLAQGLQGRLPRPAVARTLFAAALVAVAAAVANGLIITVPTGVQATVALTDATTGPGRTAHARITMTPADAADEPAWLTITGWQGGDLHVHRLERTGPGTYRTTAPMPLHGQWKTMIRLHDGRALAAVPLYLPADPAIGAHAVPAPEHLTRPLQSERGILQRELNDDVPGWVWLAASSVVLACTLALMISLGWGVSRVSRRSPTSPASAPAATPRPSARRQQQAAT
ncbi:hypothetical protein SAMN04489712_11746 [Thermomonospora echinospora]|uniref:Uncharacterized protein n=1 Tax=Thermomonospora echinospora TaxID=1992 RepID=A0A1H6DHH7_9ACTN|nr:hypothetical protein [Thermomonospora echinospora]SEG84669.1 hypothetical protein SAMN04489712_11746 [Thermomonospora echinospora]